LRASDLRQTPTLTQDDIIIVDSNSEEDLPRSQELPVKRKPKGHPRDFLPAKRQTVWVEVPPRSRRVSSAPVEQEPLDEGGSFIKVLVEAVAPAQGSAVSVPRNVRDLGFPAKHQLKLTLCSDRRSSSRTRSRWMTCLFLPGSRRSD
jgi:hypothetical protein